MYTGQDMQSANMYAYCGNNPVTRSDPFGGMYVVEDQPQGDYARKAFEIYNSYQPSRDTIQDIGEDFSNFNLQNTSEQAAIQANYFAMYKGVPVIKVSGLGGKSASFYMIFLNKADNSPETVKHEYGHRVQLDQMGFTNYLKYVAVPSVIHSEVYSRGQYYKYYSYYSMPFEYDADIKGKAVHEVDPWAEDLRNLYFSGIE